MEYQFALRTKKVTASEVREILKIVARPEIMSFAGGLPAPELFPVDEVGRQCQAVLAEQGPKALQYATTEGYNPLRQWIVDRLTNKWHINVGIDNVLITSGSQSALDMISKLMVDEGDVIWCETPTYLAALTAFRLLGPTFEAMPSDDDGVIVDGLEERILQHKPKMVYVIPTFQNPSGRTWSMERRKAFMELMTKYEIMVVEDNAYFELCFDDIEYCSLTNFDPKGLVISSCSFSKVLCPGLRVAWINAAAPVIEKLVIIKQSTDLQTATLNQMVVHRFLTHNDFDARVKMICDVYGERRDAMLDELGKSLPEGCTFTHPRGGMFVWVTMPECVDDDRLLQRCLTYNVAVVPGHSFYPVDPKKNTVRLNYSNLPPEKIHYGVSKVCQAIAEEIAASQS
ncbi:MAG: PLP-dependent aminotransferase family protein [bacterium]|nr:PLP-dependent aminotransferase family protein [bacterium]